LLVPHFTPIGVYGASKLSRFRRSPVPLPFQILDPPPTGAAVILNPARKKQFFADISIITNKQQKYVGANYRIQNQGYKTRETLAVCFQA